tara:strand:- start:121 stop:672 length:552 start_codon:yes stop_codon:yes gene_type:complete
MGLDMYLEGSFSTPSYVRPTDADYEARQEGKEIVVKRSQELEDALNAIGFQAAPIDHAYNHMTYVFPIITWRKANAIHKFFVDEVQDGNDNCERHYVPRETLHELLDRITTILDIKTPVAREMKAEELLPTDIEGCFFGTKDYDDWYYKDLEDTKKTLEKVFEYEENAESGKCFDSFYYQSSW